MRARHSISTIFFTGILQCLELGMSRFVRITLYLGYKKLPVNMPLAPSIRYLKSINNEDEEKTRLFPNLFDSLCMFFSKGVVSVHA